MPKVSIIMPSLNVEQYIRECIESVLCQTLSDIEILCIDAGSIDGTWEAINEYASKDGRMKAIYSQVRSYGYQVNLGITLAKGEYVAVVETDDYIHPEMYNYLYHISEETKADIIKADFDSFITYENGKTVFTKYKLFKGDEENYNKVIDPQKVEKLFVNDISIWKGIYRREFLLENNIQLHESNGAAFQDIGFLHQVLTYAKSAYYSDKSFYRYRMDRDGSSIHSVKSLGFAKQDFQWLIEEKNILNITPCKRGFFRHMISSLTGEMRNVLPVVGYNVESEYIKPYYDWFVDVLRAEAIEYFEYYKGLFFDFELLLDNIKEFANRVREEEQAKKKRKLNVVNAIHDKNVIIFGSGAWGTRVLEILYESNVAKIAFSDNDSELWGKVVNCIKVIPPQDIVNMFEDYLVIIANKYHAQKIKEQLLEIGVDDNNILIY